MDNVLPTGTNFSNGWATAAGTTSTLGNFAITANAASWAQSGGAGLAAGGSWCVQIGDNQHNSRHVAAPMVGSNPSTYYEVWMEWTKVDTDKLKSYVTVVQPAVIPIIPNASSGDYAICIDTYDGSLRTFAATLDGTAIGTGTYYVDIQFEFDVAGVDTKQKDSVLSSGLTLGNNYPIVSTVPTASKTATIQDTTTLATGTSSLRMQLDATAHSTAVYSFTAPVGTDDGTAYNDSSNTNMSIFFFASTSDTRVRNEYYYTTSGNANGAAFAGSTATITTIANEGNVATDNDTSGAAIKFKLTAAALTGNTDDVLLFLLPRGT